MMGIILRLIGGSYVVYAVASQGDIFQSVVIAALCFGVAAGLDRLEQIDQRTRRHSTALARLLPDQNKSALNEDLAPHAPKGWAEFKPLPRDPDRDTFLTQRIARRWRYVERPRKKTTIKK